MKNVIILLSGLMLCASVVFSEPTVWKNDAAHSKVVFTVTHMMISEVSGNFRDVSATLTQPNQDLTGSKVDVTIKAASINTDNEMRDNHLRSADFFDVTKYPEITFQSASFEKTGSDTYLIKGTLTMHGISKPVDLTAKFLGQMKNSRGMTITGFKATTVINRTDFGLVWNKTLEAGGVLVSEKVEITINAEMVKQ
jgi:polyisoprenoid-binding protein YceI